MNLVIIGISGAGKGTQAGYLAKKYNLMHISTGVLFREEYEKKSPEGLAAYEYWKDGKWVPDDVTFSLLKLYLDKNVHGFILDGFPRTQKQCEILDEYLKSHGKTFDLAIYLKVGEEEALKRLKIRAQEDMAKTGKSRLDETDELIRARFKSFSESVSPVLEYYQNKGKLLEVNGEKSREEIFTVIEERVSKLV